MNLSDRIKQQVELNFDELVATRRHIHSHPELSFEEFENFRSGSGNEYVFYVGVVFWRI